MVPPAPTTFSTTTVCFSALPIATPSIRATVSVGPPAAVGDGPLARRERRIERPPRIGDLVDRAHAPVHCARDLVELLDGGRRGGCRQAGVEPAARRVVGQLLHLVGVDSPGGHLRRSE